MKKQLALAALLLSSSATFAAPATTHYSSSYSAMPQGQVIGYLTDTKVDFGGCCSDSGLGLGVRGWWALPNSPFFLHGEYEQANTNVADVSVLRLGGGAVGPLQNNLMWIGKIEYIDFGNDVDETGFGIHGGLIFNATPELGLFGTLGYLDTDHTDGLELDLGGQFHISHELSLVGDFRTYHGSASPGDFNVDELRFGLGYTFW